MKRVKLLFTFLFIFVSITLFGCKSSKKEEETTKRDTSYDNVINLAISEVKKTVETSFSAYEEDYENYDNTIFIKNTRVLIIDDTTTINEFKNVKYVIEFVVFSDFYATKGKYYTKDITGFDTCTIYKDDSVECNNIIRKYCNSQYDYSFSFIKNIIETDAFNQEIKINISKDNKPDK